MKKIIAFFVLITFVLMLVGCSASFSKSYYEEVSNYVAEHKSSLSPSSEIEYFFYDAVNDTNENTYYGYYYSKEGVILPCEQDKMSLPKTYTEGDGGYYFGEASDESDWSFVKKIENNWYYFETHDYIYN
ncbi:MAG: hypothetical protein IJD42_06135 [Clostridia bacterium]|nr:hypothetical protein [Clostridia bacterium]